MSTGKIIRIISNLYTVSKNGELFQCRARGKFRQEKITPLVGDICEFDEREAWITKIHPRKNELNRPMVSNIDYALIVTSLKKPNYSPNLLDKLISAVTISKVKPVLFFSKLDLLEEAEKEEFKTMMKYYEKIGYNIFTNETISEMKNLLKNKVVVVTGQTGAGKSTLLNKLNPNLELKTAPISEALGRGIHTTRHTELFLIDNIYFVDTPGFSSLDINNFTKEEIRDSFIEFQKFPCKFPNCSHLKEQDCEVKKALEKGYILNSRYLSYENFMKEGLK